MPTMAETTVDIAWSAYIPHTPHPPQAVFLSVGCQEAFYGGAAGGGKMLPLDTPIPTPRGWRAMGDLRPGDQVFGMDGVPTEVLAVSSVEVVDGWMLRFDDGEEITACDEHRWLTYTAKDMTALTRRTDEFRARRRNKRPSKAGGNKSKAFTASITQRNR